MRLIDHGSDRCARQARDPRADPARLRVSLHAQVGHSPGANRPTATFGTGHTITAIGGYFGGNGGESGVGPHDGTRFGGRYDIPHRRRRSSSGLGLAYGRPGAVHRGSVVRVANRVSGPVDQSVVFAEVDLQFNLTGGKTWHGFAPFVAGGGIGVAQQDAGGHQRLSSSATSSTSPRRAGIRFFLGERLHLRAEARATSGSSSIPLSFRQEPIRTTPGTPCDPNAVIPSGMTRSAIWDRPMPWLQAGLGYSHSLPSDGRSRSPAPSRFPRLHRLYRPDWSEARNREAFGRARSEPPGHGHQYRCAVTVSGPIDAPWHADGSGPCSTDCCRTRWSTPSRAASQSRRPGVRLRADPADLRGHRCLRLTLASPARLPAGVALERVRMMRGSHALCRLHRNP